MRVLFEDCTCRTTIEPSRVRVDNENQILLKIYSGYSDDLDRFKSIKLSPEEAAELAKGIMSMVVDIEVDAHNDKPWWKRWL